MLELLTIDCEGEANFGMYWFQHVGVTFPADRGLIGITILIIRKGENLKGVEIRQKWRHRLNGEEERTRMGLG